MTAIERHRYGEPANGLRSYVRPEWAAYWPMRALSVDEQRQLDLDVEMLAWADGRRRSAWAQSWNGTYLADALDRADLHGWRRHLLLAIQARLG